MFWCQTVPASGAELTEEPENKDAPTKLQACQGGSNTGFVRSDQKPAHSDVYISALLFAYFLFYDILFTLRVVFVSLDRMKAFRGTLT